MDRAGAERFARDWIDAWNARDFETVLGWYADDLRFTSPTAFEVVGRATVVGKPALRSYWGAALERIQSLEFTLDRTLWDPERREIVIVYTSVTNGASKKVMETLQLGANDVVVATEVFHGKVPA
jgi:hypothetical protein